MNGLLFMVALLISCVIGFTFETLKMYYIIHRVKVLNYKLETFIYEFTKDDVFVDVFRIKELKELIKKNYVDKHKIDTFLIYKKNYHEIRFEYKVGDALQIIDIYLDKLNHTLHEVSLNYDDDLVYPE